jgi:acyl-coenzyme A thioesterase PaaI-like protein
MNAAETPEELEARIELATAMQQLGHALVAHRIDPQRAAELTEFATTYADRVSRLPARDRVAEVTANPRFAALLAGGARSPIDDGDEINLFNDSPVSGRTNPMGIGIRARREGDTAVTTTTLGPAFEGAPGRAHGGVVAAILDETMGYVLPIVGEIAYTANLNIDYLAPAPVGVPITFTARLRDKVGRKLWIEATGESPEGPFVRAEALFLAVELEKFSSGEN